MIQMVWLSLVPPLSLTLETPSSLGLTTHHTLLYVQCDVCTCLVHFAFSKDMHLFFLNPVTIYHISSRRERELPYSYRYHVIGMRISNLTTDQH